MLTRARLRDDAPLAHPPRQQHLSQRIVDLVRAGVQKIFAFQINLRSASMCAQPLRMKQWRWPATIISQQLVEFAQKVRILAGAHELLRQLLERRDQSLRNVTTTELAPMPVLIRLAFSNR